MRFATGVADSTSVPLSVQKVTGWSNRCLGHGIVNRARTIKAKLARIVVASPLQHMKTPTGVQEALAMMHPVYRMWCTREFSVHSMSKRVFWLSLLFC